MTFIKLLFLFILITMMEHHGIIYRTGKKSKSPAENSGKMLSNRNKLHGSWRLVGKSKDESTLLFPYQEDAIEGSPGKRRELLVSFFPDSTFTQIGTRGEYLTGRWAYDDKNQSVFLTQGRNTQEILLSFDKASNGLRLISFELNNLQVLSLIEDGKTISRYQDDPFYPGQNLWRVKPQQPEDKKKLLWRLRNYILHTARVLKAAESRGQNRVSLEFSLGIIQLYNVGIGIVKKDKIPLTWINAFHSREDALKAYDLFEDYLITARHKKFNSGNWFQDDYHILIDINNGLARR